MQPGAIFLLAIVLILAYGVTESSINARKAKKNKENEEKKEQQ